MSARKRTVQVSQTVWDWLKDLVERGDYASLDDAATDLLGAYRRQYLAQCAPKLSQDGPTKPVVSPPAVAESQHRGAATNKFVSAWNR